MANLRDALRAAVLLPILSLGCQDKPAGPDVSDSATTTTVTARGLPEISRDTADAYREETVVLRKAMQSMNDLTEADHQAYWSAVTKQRQLADEMKGIIDVHPHWAQSICEWYASQIQPAHIESVRLRNALNGRNTTSQDRNDYRTLLMDAAGSTDAARAHIGAMMDHPGDPTQLYVMCVKLGYIKEQ